MGAVQAAERETGQCEHQHAEPQDQASKIAGTMSPGR